MDTVAAPSGATITACSNPTGGFSCGAPTGGANNSVTATCGASGCTSSASFQVTITSTAVGALNESIAISQPGNADQVFPLNGAATFVPPTAGAPTKSCT